MTFSRQGTDRRQYEPPTDREVAEARRVLAALRQARLRARRYARHGSNACPAGMFVYPTAPYLCGYCGSPFEGRRGNYGRVRYCSASCRTLAYQARKAARERRAARAETN